MTRALSAALREAAERLYRYHDVCEAPGPADLIVGLGSYQPAVADHCAGLYRAGIAPAILFTGGLGNWTRGVFERPEAEIFRDRAIAAGVPSSAILVEPEARNLGENATLARRLVEAAGVAVGRIVVIAKRNTTRRARSTFRMRWPQVMATFAGPELHWTRQAVSPRTTEDVVDEMVGDLQRILIYPELGHQVADSVPADVLAGYGMLAEAGFDRHLLPGFPVMPQVAVQAPPP